MPSSRKTTEEDAQRLAYHVENTPLAVIEWDKDLFISRWSGQAAKIFGWTAQEAIGQQLYDPCFPLVYNEDRPKVNSVAHDLTHGQTNGKLSLNRNNTKDGKIIYCEWYNSVLRDEHGNVVTILSLTQDVTERVLSENIRKEERKYIAREIHDELGQYLTVLKLNIGSLKKQLNEMDETVQNKLHELNDLTDSIIDSVRRIASALRPGLLENAGLAAAIGQYLKEFEARSGISIDFIEPYEEWDLPEAMKTHIFRILQESLTNVARHSGASRVHVALTSGEGLLTLSITDNGTGFDPENNNRQTLGILGIKERTAIIGGLYEIQSKPGLGTTISVTIQPGSKIQ